MRSFIEIAAKKAKRDVNRFSSKKWTRFEVSNTPKGTGNFYGRLKFDKLFIKQCVKGCKTVIIEA
jgi:hypothetical protein